MLYTACQNCGKLIPKYIANSGRYISKKTGRPRKFCSQRCFALSRMRDKVSHDPKKKNMKKPKKVGFVKTLEEKEKALQAYLNKQQRLISSMDRAIRF